VREITVDSHGRPNGVVYRSSSGLWSELRAKLIGLAASATETPRLLLNSKSNWFPTGLGNQHDQVGRHIHEDQRIAVYGFFDDVVGDLQGPGPSCALDFQFEQADVPAGGIIYSGFSRLPVRMVNTVPRPEGMKSWGREFKDSYRRYFWKHIRIYRGVHGIPRERNRVDIDPEVRNSNGIPAARITHRAHGWSTPQREWMASRAKLLLKEAGAKFTLRRWVAPQQARVPGNISAGVAGWGQILALRSQTGPVAFTMPRMSSSAMAA
jgi:hypothetical protein